MLKDKKMNLVVSVIIILILVSVLVYITVNKKDSSEEQNVQVGQNTNMENTQQVDGVKITVLKEGTGDAAKAGDTVAMNYTGTLEDGTAFDSNIDPKFNHVEPFVFALGTGQVIKGWDIGVNGMKAGEQRKLEINPEYGYGPDGYPPVIPKNAKLTFIVELVAIKK